jgi:hypothetical protein
MGVPSVESSGVIEGVHRVSGGQLSTAGEEGSEGRGKARAPVEVGGRIGIATEDR